MQWGESYWGSNKHADETIAAQRGEQEFCVSSVTCFSSRRGLLMLVEACRSWELSSFIGTFISLMVLFVWMSRSERSWAGMAVTMTGFAATSGGAISPVVTLIPRAEGTGRREAPIFAFPLWILVTPGLWGVTSLKDWPVHLSTEKIFPSSSLSWEFLVLCPVVITVPYKNRNKRELISIIAWGFSEPSPPYNWAVADI